ncbi:molybdate ABC transporter substrate-binding protein [Massilia sp. Leaf139]|uniref:molybdate ABC transporter substrate-binding protein n=1 Tax=Massilia sp. Leaf139 TaxID=1736272 RepID=UPI0006F6F2C1|nr:molybdate ABC transporter substrate-binding protein [Massilia sp. Leaf139]KQQ88659.1 molybdate ABC transporter substrate-binding protein [Massilia sp. Leaf139]
MKKLLCFLLAATLSMPALARPLLVAAASDLGYCIDELVGAYRKTAPDAEPKVSLGASGNFFAQISNGAPFDVFLSADMDYPRQLAKLGAADGATLLPYAIGRIALWSLDPQVDPQRGLAALVADPNVRRLAIANPVTAPYGRAAKAALVRAGLWDEVQAKLVVGENIAQTAQFVQTGNAQIGIVSYATLHATKLKGVGRHALLPATGMAPIEQGAIVTRAGAANPHASGFIRFLASPEARAILARNGFNLPAGAAE